ncbi:MAG: M14-type cytosolic carboxypeptidase, partial [Verrucomicrobiae bacterium]|nr:M14-type cytosolic carboxypeptidase [Verrucomicrobiae bacterium]
MKALNAVLFARAFAWSVGAIVVGATLTAAQEIPSVTGWQIASPTPASHRACVDLAAPRAGKGCGKIVGTASERGSRGGFIQEFHDKTAIKPGRTYRYAVSYRTSAPFAGSGSIVIDSYTAEGDKSRKELVSRQLGATAEWWTVSGEVVVPEQAIRVRLLLFLRGAGTIWYDEAFFGHVAEDSPNLLRNGGLEPPGSYAYELAPAKGKGRVKLIADFDNATLGKVKEIGTDEFYARAFPDGKPRSPFLWFHFRVEGAAGREVTFHINTAPFSRENTGGNGTRLPVASDDGDHWTGIENKSWSEDGTVLSFKHRFQHSPAWVASFFPFTDAHIARFIEQHRASPHFKTGALGKTAQGRDLRLLTLTDPDVPEAGKRVIMLIALQHDLETTGAMAVEGLCRFLLSGDPRAARLRRAFVFY